MNWQRFLKRDEPNPHPEKEKDKNFAQKFAQDNGYELVRPIFPAVFGEWYRINNYEYYAELNFDMYTAVRRPVQ